LTRHCHHAAPLPNSAFDDITLNVGLDDMVDRSQEPIDLFSAGHGEGGDNPDGLYI
jgi:hypothetical protein